jgi:hypothetical protein
MGLRDPPYRETGTRDFGLYPWRAFCMENKKYNLFLTSLVLVPGLVCLFFGPKGYFAGYMIGAWWAWLATGLYAQHQEDQKRAARENRRVRKEYERELKKLPFK